MCWSALVNASMLSAAHGDVEHSAVGLFNSIMFPTIFSLGVAELGPLTGKGSGILNHGHRGRGHTAIDTGRHCRPGRAFTTRSSFR